MIVTRFAPSPNGALHLGHAYSAIVAHDLARAGNGRFLLRIEDIDRERSKPELAEASRRDLEWLGLEWEEVPAQSTRFEHYQTARKHNFPADSGLLYRCQCTRSQIAAASTRSGPDGPIYAGTCRMLDLGPDTGAFNWRLDIVRATHHLAQVFGGVSGDFPWVDDSNTVHIARPEFFGDPILFRKDDWPSYHFAVTLDDADDGITLVTRGDDLLGATDIHRVLQAVMGLPVPRWHHHPLLLDDQGHKLAKRRGSPSLADRRLAGEDGRALADELRGHRLPAGISLSGPLHKDP